MSTYGDLGVHRWMLRDGIRNEAYRRALTHVVKPGDVVLDMGAGTGILSIFAAAAGARKVYAIERTGVAEVARRVIAANNYTDRIEVIHSDVEDVVLPERANVLVSEWMGGFGVDENMLAPLVIARDRWLAPGGIIVPGRVTAFVAPVTVDELDAELDYLRSQPQGVDLAILATMTTHETFHSQANLLPASLVAEPQEMWSHDAYTCTLEDADRSFVSQRSFKAARRGHVTAFAAWFSADMGDGTKLTNAIGEPITHWGRTLFPLDHAVEVTPGTPIELDLHCDPSTPGNVEVSWSVTIGDRPPEQHDTRRARQQRIASGM